MEVLDAIRSRKSIRAFRPDPVPEPVLIKLLGVALITLGKNFYKQLWAKLGD